MKKYLNYSDHELLEGISQALSERDGKLVLLAIDSEEEVLLLCGSDRFKVIADALRAHAQSGLAESHEFAETITSGGRWCLRVAGVVVAMEGDIIRTSMIPDRCWTRENLTDLCKRINAEHDDRVRAAVAAVQ